MPCSDYTLSVTGEWPLHPSGGADSLGVLFHLREQDESRASPRGIPDVLHCSAGFLASMLKEALRDGHYIRVDVARAEAAEAPWPRWCLNESQITGLINGFRERVARPDGLASFYPILFWLIPSTQKEIESAIDQVRVDRFNSELFSRILAAGVVRISYSDRYGDVLAEPYVGENVLRWLDRARRLAPDVSIDWRIEPG